MHAISQNSKTVADKSFFIIETGIYHVDLNLNRIWALFALKETNISVLNI